MCPTDDENALRVFREIGRVAPQGCGSEVRRGAVTLPCFRVEFVRCEMECPNCHMDLPERAKFCSQCGLALALNCPSCGNSEAPGSKFCTKCGAGFHVASVVPASPELAPGLLPRTTF